MNSKQNNFSHIYVERVARDYPWTDFVLRRFPKAEKIWIDDYKDVFSRSRQHFLLQKSSMKLILAVKRTTCFILAATTRRISDILISITMLLSLTVFTTATTVTCGVCILSANVVVFVNLEDFFEAVRQVMTKHRDPTTPLYLALSYDTDLLAFESLIPYCGEWIEFSRQKKNLVIEIRTKSTNYRALRERVPHPRAVLAWTLSPEPIVRTYEKQTPSLARRLEAAAQAIADGWSVRLCFDPVLKIPHWREAYQELLETTFAQLPPEKIRDVSVGVFRMNAHYFKRMQKFHDDTDVLSYPYERTGKTITYAETERRELTGTMKEFLKEYFCQDKIALWT